MTVPDRVSWAIEIMEIRPDDRLLEIGPGNGVALAVVSERLVDGTITGIDRSTTAVEAASRRNTEGIASGRVVVENVAIEAATFPDGSFTKVFAINVNLFWVRDPAVELTLIRRMLTPGGRLYLFFEPPTAGQIPEMRRRLAARLEDAGFTVSIRMARRSNRSILCVAGRATDPLAQRSAPAPPTYMPPGSP